MVLYWYYIGILEIADAMLRKGITMPPSTTLVATGHDVNMNKKTDATDSEAVDVVGD